MPVDSHSHFLRKFCSSKIELIRIAILPSGDRKGTSLSTAQFALQKKNVETLKKIKRNEAKGISNFFAAPPRFAPILIFRNSSRDGRTQTWKSERASETNWAKVRRKGGKKKRNEAAGKETRSSSHRTF